MRDRRPRSAGLNSAQPRTQGVDARDGLGRRFNMAFWFQQDWCLSGQPEATAHRAATTATTTSSAARGDAHVEVRSAVIEVHGTSIH
jgi:hypothetical protein